MTVFLLSLFTGVLCDPVDFYDHSKDASDFYQWPPYDVAKHQLMDSNHECQHDDDCAGESECAFYYNKFGYRERNRACNGKWHWNTVNFENCEIYAYLQGQAAVESVANSCSGCYKKDGVFMWSNGATTTSCQADKYVCLKDRNRERDASDVGICSNMCLMTTSVREDYVVPEGEAGQACFVPHPKGKMQLHGRFNRHQLATHARALTGLMDAPFQLAAAAVTGVFTKVQENIESVEAVVEVAAQDLEECAKELVEP